LKVKYLKKQIKAADVREKMVKHGLTETFLNKVNTLVVNGEDMQSAYGMRQAAPGFHSVSPFIEMKYRDHDFIKMLKRMGVYSINCITRDKDVWVFAIATSSGNSYAFKEERKNPAGGVYSQMELTTLALCEYLSVKDFPEILATYIFFSVPTTGNVLLDGNLTPYEDLKTVNGTESDKDAVIAPMESEQVIPQGGKMMGGHMTLDDAPAGLKEAFLKTMAEEAQNNQA
jgi:hypothetical protein